MLNSRCYCEQFMHVYVSFYFLNVDLVIFNQYLDLSVIMMDFYLLFHLNLVFKIDCKLTFIFECNADVSKSNQQLRDWNQFPASSFFSSLIGCITQYGRKYLLLLPFHQDFNSLNRLILLNIILFIIVQYQIGSQINIYWNGITNFAIDKNIN